RKRKRGKEKGGGRERERERGRESERLSSLKQLSRKCSLCANSDERRRTVRPLRLCSDEPPADAYRLVRRLPPPTGRHRCTAQHTLQTRTGSFFHPEQSRAATSSRSFIKACRVFRMLSEVMLTTVDFFCR
ncbi:hypothetical protein ALC62_09834, partial [Cyphomyrmex costatus]